MEGMDGGDCSECGGCCLKLEGKNFGAVCVRADAYGKFVTKRRRAESPLGKHRQNHTLANLRACFVAVAVLCPKTC